MRHEGGIHRLHKLLQVEDMLPENIKQNAIGKVIETDSSLMPEGYKRRYHAICRDWISNEIFRRVEPQGRTMGEVLREIGQEHGIDIRCGLIEEEMDQR